jgi:hypothetical protein
MQEREHALLKRIKNVISSEPAQRAGLDQARLRRGESRNPSTLLGTGLFLSRFLHPSTSLRASLFRDAPRRFGRNDGGAFQQSKGNRKWKITLESTSGQCSRICKSQPLQSKSILKTYKK